MIIPITKIPSEVLRLTGRHVTYQRCYRAGIDCLIPVHRLGPSRVGMDPADVIKHFKLDTPVKTLSTSH